MEGASASAVAADACAGHGQRLLLWDAVSPEGDLRLNPAFALDIREELPSRAGQYRLEGFGVDGARESPLDFGIDELGRGGGSFLFAIPFEEGWTRSLERIVLTGPEGAAELNGDSDQAMGAGARPRDWTAAICPGG